ncbi:MAG TPA: hypothetical protein DC049_00220, partial [Spirochaetia bacterium]|nr:hypothetical protein [Spirochaetia bacterium]
NIFDNTYANCSSYSVLYASNNYFGQRNWNDKKINASINTWTPWANSFMNFTTDWTSPAIPGNINAVKNTSYEIVLSWNAVADNDFSNYNIFRTTEANCNYLSDSNIISKVYTKTTTSFTNTITQPGNYYYYITAVDIYSNESWYSSCSPIITVEQITNPTISSCTPIATNAIIIDWIDLSNEDAYLLYRSTVSNTNTAILISAILSNVNHYTNNNLLPNTTYYYWLKSSNISGVSKHSTAVCATTYPMIPDVPIIQSVIVNSPNDITVTWQDVARETAYLLYTNTETNTAGASICTTLAADVTSYNNTGLKVLTKYYYWLKSSNISGMSDFSATTSGTTLKEYDIIAPNIVFMPTNGLFLTNILLSIAASDNETISEKIKIYYTFDEKEPQMKDENRYSEKILFKTGHTYIISAIAVDEMGNRASILNQKYTIDCFADMTLNQKTKEILSHLSSVQAIELKGMGYKEKEIEYLATAKDDVTATIITEPSQPVGIMLKSLQGGFIVKKIHIKNLDGTIVQEIQCSGFNNNVMMVYWDKNTRNGSRVKTGIYVISIEYFDNNVPKNITRLLVVAN